MAIRSPTALVLVFAGALAPLPAHGDVVPAPGGPPDWSQTPAPMPPPPPEKELPAALWIAALLAAAIAMIQTRTHTADGVAR